MAKVSVHGLIAAALTGAMVCTAKDTQDEDLGVMPDTNTSDEHISMAMDDGSCSGELDLPEESLPDSAPDLLEGLETTEEMFEDTLYDAPGDTTAGTQEVVDPCGGACSEPYPYCASVGGTWQCVICTMEPDSCTQTYGPECHCVNHTFCVDGLGNCCWHSGPLQLDCAGIHAKSQESETWPPGMFECSLWGVDYWCETDSDCPPDYLGRTLVCLDGECIEPGGTCDGMNSCCSHGQCCINPFAAMNYLMLAGVPGDFLGAYCSCDEAHPCPAGVPCTDVTGLCDRPDMEGLCPDGKWPEKLPVTLCTELDTIVDILEPFLAFWNCPARCDGDADCQGPEGTEAFCVPGPEETQGWCLDKGGRCGPGVCCAFSECRDLAAAFLCPGGKCPRDHPPALNACLCGKPYHNCLLGTLQCSNLSDVCHMAPELCPEGNLPPGVPDNACVDLEELVSALGGP